MQYLNCEICHSSLQFSANAVVSPWIRSLGVRGKRASKYMTCNNCCSGFFDFRYSEGEMSKIYGDYRGEKYLNSRQKWEPWYNQAFNEGHDSEEFISMRQESLHKFLHNRLPSIPKTLVDFGGDRGQYIPNFGQLNSFVIESSKKQLVKGVMRLKSLNDISRCDLILYSHVLEHVAKPKEEVELLLQHCDQLYIEVPYGVPDISKARKSKIKFVLKLVASFSPILWRKSSKPATGRSRQQGVLVQSEHINFFSEKSLQDLAQSLHLVAHIEVNLIKTPDRAEALVIQCLFTPSPDKKAYGLQSVM